MTHLDFSSFIVGLTPRISVLPKHGPEKERKTILIVDDATARLLLRLALQSEPYQILEAADGETALSLCSSSQPDLILLNIALPRTDGITVLQQIRQLNQQVIIVMISAINIRNWIDEAFAQGADGFAIKPFSLMAMRQVVAHLLACNVNKHAPDGTHCFVPYGGKRLGAGRPSRLICE